MNNCVLIGRLTKDPELRYLPNSSVAVCNFTLAVDKQLSKDKKEEFESKGYPTADFINIVVWNKQAENCANYLAKGRLVAVQGSIQTRNWEDQEGRRRYATEVVANNVQFLEWGDKNDNTSNNNNGFQEVNDDELPF
jgi:single-strand DNA-binding protein